MDDALVSSHKVIWNGQNHCEIFLRCLLIQFRSGWRLEERKMPVRRVTSFSEKAMCMMFMKGLPLANRWPYTDGSAGLGTSGESAMLF